MAISIWPRKRVRRATPIAEMVAVTAWQPHTMRAALTGLRKKGHAIERSTRGYAASYTIAAR